MIHGKEVSLRPATKHDRRDIYIWLTTSDVTPFMMGPPAYPDVSIPTWDEFCGDYTSLFFDGSQPDRGRSFIIEVDGQSIGHISYDGLDSKRSFAELDIWMRSQECCGHGYGTDALVALMGHLCDDFEIRKCIVRPSLRNRRAVRAYKKAGFRSSELSVEEQSRIYGRGEYSDTITLECNIVS